jgi:glycosyltransferase involved in cell wall biosynthesis
MRIVVVVNSLQQGGAERAAIRLAEAFVYDGHEVIISTWSNKRDFYSLSQGTPRVNLGDFFDYKQLLLPIFGTRFNRISLMLNAWRYRRQILSLKPDVVICFEALVGSITAVSLACSRAPLIISERVNPDPDVYLPHRIAQIVRPKIYKREAICSVQTQGFSDWVLMNWKVPAAVTPNHIPDSWIGTPKSFTDQKRKIVSIGRVEPQKGFDILLKAWNRLGPAKDGWSLEIIGSQNNPEYLHDLKSKTHENVVFSPPTHEISAILDDSTILVSSSRFEGFPNVVLEALARGVPTIASFSTDIVNDWDEFGALLGYDPEDAEALAEHLRTLMNSPELLEKFSVQGLNVAKNYTWEAVGCSWYQAIDQAINQKKLRRR